MQPQLSGDVLHDDDATGFVHNSPIPFLQPRLDSRL